MSNLQPDYAASIDFLRKMHPGRRWVLTAITLDKKRLPTDTFDESRETECLAWLEKYGANHNLYFSVGEVARDVQKKAERTDISKVWWLHVDIDPRAGEDIAQEQARALGLLQKPPGMPPPTAIVFSGGGYQGFWQLRGPIAIDCDLAKAEDAKLYNLAIELALGADNVHDISRIMRLPGTLNRPDPLKVKKGRTIALATLAEWHPERVYDIGQFAKSRAVAETGNAERPKVTLSDTVKPIASVDQLPISDRAKVVIVQGLDPDEPNKFGNPPDRSKWLLYACCEMVRGGCDDDTVYSVITDPRFGISASVLDKGSMIERYAHRQISRAKDFADNDDPVSLINRQYFAVLEGKKIIFYREENDKTITAMNAEAFSFATAPIKVTISATDAKGNKKPMEVEAAKLWRASQRRRFYGRGFVLDPTHSHSDDEYNLWKGFGVQPAPGEWSRMRLHIEQVLAAGNQAHAEYIIKWAAWTFQNPATPPRVALVFRGDEGTGKGVFGRALVTAFGNHGQRVQNISHVAGRFNAHMRHCCMFFADEVSLVSDDQEGNLKGMITEPTLPVEAKGVDIVHADNHLHVVMASNRDFIIPAGIGARRFAMFDVPPTFKGNTEYWAALYGEIDRGGIAAMLHDLIAYPLGNWHPEAARPDTKALSDQKLRSLLPLQRHWANCLHSGTLDCGADRQGGKAFIPSEVFVELINSKLGLKNREQITTSALKVIFKQFGFTKVDKGRPRGWEIPPLPEARKAWDEKMNIGIDWGEEDCWQMTMPTAMPDDANTRSAF